MERLLTKFETPEEAERRTREAYQAMTPNERVALTVKLQRQYYGSQDAPRRLQRVLTVLERT